MHTLKDTILAAVSATALMFMACAGTQNGEASKQNGTATGGTSAEQTASAVENAEGTGVAAAKATAYKLQQEEKQAMLEQTFAGLLAEIRNGTSPRDLLPFITDTSEYWLDDLEAAARVEREEELNVRSFAEVYAILRYRIYEREHMWGDVTEYKMLSLVLAQKGILERLTELKLGPMKVKEDRGSVGLESSPEVPVLLFVWDDVKWEFDVKASMPLVTKGIESIGVKKNWTNTKLAIYLLEKEFRFEFSRVDDSLLDPATAF